MDFKGEEKETGDKILDKAEYLLDPEDIISIHGGRRVEIDELLGKLQKGRIKLRLKCYL